MAVFRVGSWRSLGGNVFKAIEPTIEKARRPNVLRAETVARHELLLMTKRTQVFI